MTKLVKIGELTVLSSKLYYVIIEALKDKDIQIQAEPIDLYWVKYTFYADGDSEFACFYPNDGRDLI